MCLHGFSQSGHVQLAFSSALDAWEQRQLAGGEDVLDVARHLAGEQLRERQGARGHRLLDASPLRLGERLDADAHAVGRVAGALDLRDDDAGLHVELGHLAAPRVVAPALQP